MEDDNRNGDRQYSEDRSRGRSREMHESRNKDPDNYTQIYIAKLHKKTNEDDLKSKFSEYGKIKQVTLKHTYAFIDFDDHEAAVRAVKEMNKVPFVNGEELVVEQSVPGGKKRKKGP